MYLGRAVGAGDGQHDRDVRSDHVVVVVDARRAPAAALVLAAFLRHLWTLQKRRADRARARRVPRHGVSGRHTGRGWSGSGVSAGSGGRGNAITILLTHALNVMRKFLNSTADCTASLSSASRARVGGSSLPTDYRLERRCEPYPKLT